MNSNDKIRVKVLFLASWYPNEDNPVTGIFIKHQAEAVSKFCDVAVLYRHSSQTRKNSFIEYTIENGINTIRVYNPSIKIKNRTLKYIFEFTAGIITTIKGLNVVKKKFGRPDIVHIQVILPMGGLGLLIKFFKGWPLILSEHTGPFNVYTKNFVANMICKIIINQSDVIMPVSNFLKEQMKPLMDRKVYKIIPNVIDSNKFFPDMSKKPSTRKKRIIHVSILDDKQKNISGIIRAIESISHKRDDFEFHIIGDGIDRKNLEILSNQLNLDKFIFFHGVLRDANLASFYRQCDFFVLNSPQETFAVVCAEALFSGIPVIATRCGGPEDYINNNVGLLINPGDQNELIAAINDMLDNSDKYDPKFLHEYANSKFGYDIVGNSIYEIYLSILSKHGNIEY